MNEIKLNSVPLNRVGLNVIGEIRSSANDGPISYPNGVYIQHIDGKLYTTDEWTAKGYANEDANGVAVIADDAQFVIAKNTQAKTYGNSNVAPSSGYITTSQDAMKDMWGRKTTTELFDASQNNAIAACASYVFPNGAKGYLPSYGEMYVASLWNDDIKTAMAVIGGVTVRTLVWTSTFYDNTQTWYFYILGTSGGYTNSLNTVRTVIPFTELVL